MLGTSDARTVNSRLCLFGLLALALAALLAHEEVVRLAAHAARHATMQNQAGHNQPQPLKMAD